MEVWNGYVTFRSHSWKATQEGLVPFLQAVFMPFWTSLLFCWTFETYGKEMETGHQRPKEAKRGLC